MITFYVSIVSATPWPGGDFSQGLAPTLNDVLADGQGGIGPATATVDKGKGKNKGAGRGRKGKGKGDHAASSGANGDGNTGNEPPVEETTPIQKARALARNVFLSCIRFGTQYRIHVYFS